MKDVNLKKLKVTLLFHWNMSAATLQTEVWVTMHT